MSKHTELNACRACARSKRRCGRQTPSCARCVERGSSCIYPSSRSRAALSASPLLPGGSAYSILSVKVGPTAQVSDNTPNRMVDLILEDDLLSDRAFPAMDSDSAVSSSLFIQSPGTPVVQAAWFHTPGTWEVNHRLDAFAAIMPVGEEYMRKFIAVLQSWLERWATTGSNPFIHSRLYSVNFPACAQVAYATLACYIHRTPANSATVLRIVEERSNDLLRGNGASRKKVDMDEWADGEDQDVDLFMQLARLQALIVYQIIGLFDGDIRSRHVAEGHIAVKNSWASKLFHSAGRILSNTQIAGTHLVGSLPSPSTFSQQQWYLWILSESIRRTRLIAVSVVSIFSLLQQRWSACPGGTMYTDHSGLWDAASATEWEKQCSERNPPNLQRFGNTMVFEGMKPVEVDEFGMAMLDMAFNQEVLERWRNQSRDMSRGRSIIHC